MKIIDDYNKEKSMFDRHLREDGYMIPFYVLASMVPTFITVIGLALLGLNGTKFGKKLTSIVEIITGIVPGLAALVIYFPVIIGSIIDNLISRIIPSYRNLAIGLVAKLENRNIGSITQGQHSYRMSGMFGFALGIVPDLLMKAFTAIVRTACSVLGAVSFTLTDAINTVYSSIFSKKPKNIAEVQSQASHSVGMNDDNYGSTSDIQQSLSFHGVTPAVNPLQSQFDHEFATQQVANESNAYQLNHVAEQDLDTYSSTPTPTTEYSFQTSRI